MIYRHTQEEINDYFQRNALNQTALKILARGDLQTFLVQKDEIVKAPDDLYYEEKAHFIVGSAVDCYITQGEEVFNARYHYSKMVKKPSAVEMSIIKQVFDRVTSEMVTQGELANLNHHHPIASYPEQIYDAQNDHQYLTNRKKPMWLDDNRGNTMLKSGVCQQYWQELIDAGDKQVLSDTEKTIIDDICISLLTHKHTKWLFEDSSDIDTVYQMPIYFEYEGEDCKVLIDIIRIQHKAKRIVPLDIKTSGFSTLTFNRSIKFRRYDIQGSFYMQGLKIGLSQLGDYIGKDLGGYSIANFAFIAQSTIVKGPPLIFPLDADMLVTGRFGDILNDLKGWKYAIGVYKRWKAYDFSIEHRFAGTNGVIQVGKNFEYLEPL